MAIFLSIYVAGHLDTGWLDWFNGLEMRYTEDGTTELFGTVVDQAALHGSLNQARDSGLTLVSVCAKTRRIDEEDDDEQ